MSTLAVVVATRDRPEMLERCLASLRVSLRPDDELIVVDSASRDPAAVAKVAQRHDAVLVRADRPGVNHARNLGWRRATAPVVAFADDDIEVEADWADGFRNGIGEHAFATGWIGAPEGSRSRVAVKDLEEPELLTASTRGTFGHGASMAVRTSQLEAIGGWDELLGAGARFRSAPELDLFDRLLRLGTTGVYLPQARAVHHQWRTDREVALLHVRYSVGGGAWMAKLLRLDRVRFRRAVHELVWEWGVRDAVRELQQRRPAHAAVAFGRLFGYLGGFLGALFTPVRTGHFVERRPRA